jgi:hypothetical protein
MTPGVRAVALGINWRLKNRGMRWQRVSANVAVALRVEQRNRDWEAGIVDLLISP